MWSKKCFNYELFVCSVTIDVTEDSISDDVNSDEEYEPSFNITLR